MRCAICWLEGGLPCSKHHTQDMPQPKSTSAMVKAQSATRTPDAGRRGHTSQHASRHKGPACKQQVNPIALRSPGHYHTHQMVAQGLL
jgi:hypothetical protein